MITQNSNNRAAGSISKTCDPIIPIGAIDKTNNVYVAMSLSSTGVVNTSINSTTDPMTMASLGLWGSNFYIGNVDGNTPLGKYYTCIQILTDAVLAVGVGQTREFDQTGVDVDISELSGLTIPAGTLIYGYFSKVQIVSGSAKCMANPLY